MTVRFLSELSHSDVRNRIGLFRREYKEHWRRWLAAVDEARTIQHSAIAFRRTLQGWQAVRARVGGRVVRYSRTEQPDAELHIDDLLAEADPYLQQLAGLSLREVRTASFRQRRALRRLWNVFKDLPTIGEARCVGITKAVKLSTLGRIGPALDSVVRGRLGIDEPRDGAEWVDALAAISADLYLFERRENIGLEELVEREWQPVHVGRAYDMAAGPSEVPAETGEGLRQSS